ncbi:putative secreted glycosyl hydrolase [Fimbriiglobus ruber]|uniref:Putative secreted glycosyl hydrolase n=1 Tax=Fimbriiglobus ruber TaxID=1908690 RepID=A0A225DSL8_9BACT|nr:putative secreted glycosyl hydrolase [Fimbriiglobus ruber]
MYGLAGPKVDANKPIGEWNTYRITAIGSVVTIELNGKEVVRTDLSQWTKPGVNPNGTKNKFPHAIGALPQEGFVGLQNYNATPVWFRGVRIKVLGDRKPKYTGREPINQVLTTPETK